MTSLIPADLRWRYVPEAPSAYLMRTLGRLSDILVPSAAECSEMAAVSDELELRYPEAMLIEHALEPNGPGFITASSVHWSIVHHAVERILRQKEQTGEDD